jgi:hypothetical protein
MAKTRATENLYDEVDSMMLVSALIYDLAILNGECKRDKVEGLKNREFLEKCHKTSSEVTAWFDENLKAMQTEHDNFNEDLKEQLKILSKRDDADSQSGEYSLEAFDDEFGFGGREAEIVYGITRNPDTKRITVAFRGSQQAKDWFQNLRVKRQDLELTEEYLEAAIPDPDLELVKKFSKVRVHSGFFQYLFTQQQKTDKTTKFVEIMTTLTKLLSQEENEGFSVFFTGHSLGAALATLAGAACSISKVIKNEVTVISFASPQAGKQDFTDAFQELEKAGRIRHLRVTNNNDVVPQALGLLGYKHTGIHLNLGQGALLGSMCCLPCCCTKHYSISNTDTRGILFRTNHMKFSLGWFNPFCGCGGIAIPHSMTEHRKRLVKVQSQIEELTLTNLYKDSKLRGY